MLLEDLVFRLNRSRSKDRLRHHTRNTRCAGDLWAVGCADSRLCAARNPWGGCPQAPQRIKSFHVTGSGKIQGVRVEQKSWSVPDFRQAEWSNRQLCGRTVTRPPFLRHTERKKHCRMKDAESRVQAYELVPSSCRSHFQIRIPGYEVAKRLVEHERIEHRQR